MRLVVLLVVLAGLCLTGLPAKAERSGTAASPLRVLLIPADGGTEDGTKADFVPLFNAITRTSGIHFDVQTGQSYAAVIEGMCAGQAEIAWLGPVSYVEAHRRGCADLLAIEERDGSSTYYAGIFVSQASGIDTPDELSGKSIALGSQHSASSFSYPLAMLSKAGIDPLRDLGAIRITGSHANSLLALQNGLVDAAGASFISFERAVNQGGLNASEFRLLIKSDPIPNPPIAMHPGLPETVKESLKSSLGNVHRTPGIRPESIRGYGGKQVDRYNTDATDALFEAMAGTIGFIDTDYQTAVLRKSGS
ncbi:MAG TPA: phosphate/phosphite/phosphonate ABC transporter substrate-binding protein [Hyphomonas adhaerens]|uniref:Phosphate/phosphite/phosphonate ABC transporter substrate-binding protein n=2 Tax=Hyphomonadaceae TaxID=69657 RepID=A0A3B9GWG7_9PROT|nr:phosphonate ABC transporter substrate-binding protein [Hyphomonas sp.]HAE26783.1 phosphate/phosphite/phosphonate ABC transporter substrate-binding protein [Hyphomonas adhaerens]